MGNEQISQKSFSVGLSRAAVDTLQCLCCSYMVSTLCMTAIQCLQLGDALKDLAQGKV